jgi:translation elongation factor P/translation initiation factor 5A
MSEIKKGEYVKVNGFRCKVVDTGTCEDDGCGKPTVTLIDPEGNEDTLHEADCERE